jgi:putative hydrolase of the HAD superfamily
MKRTIFFDLGNVLIFFSHQKMCEQAAKYAGLDLELVKRMMHEHGDAHERGHHNSQKIYSDFCRLSQKELDFGTLMHAISDIFEPNAPVIEIAKALKEKGHRLFLLSNTFDAHFEFAFSQFPFLKIFDGYVLSYEVGARKPEKEIYEKALEIAGCGKQECFYTDDILDYIESARSLDIDAEQYRNPEELVQHLKSRNIL